MSKKKKENQTDDLPGYPHYPAEEDITRNSDEIQLDIENIARNTNVNSTINAAGSPGRVVKEKESLDETVSGSLDGISEADLTEEDLQALGEIGMSMDGGDDEILRNMPFDAVAGDGELDIPGAELDDENEDVGNEDEENNYYSLGADKD